MRVVHISRIDRGGAANGCIGLHHGLLDQGIDSQLLVLEKTRSDIRACHSLYNHRHTLQIAKVKNKLWGCKRYKKRGLPSGYEDFTFPYSSHRPESHELVKSAHIVNLHWVANFINYPTFFKQLSKPVFWTLHDMNPFSGGCHFVEGFPIDAYCKHIRSNTKVKTEALSKSNVTVISPSQWLAHQSSQSEAFNSFPHHVIPYSVDVETFRARDVADMRQKFDIAGNKPVLLFVAARMQNKRKGLEYLLKAMRSPLLKDKFELVVVGAISENMDLPAHTKVLGQLGSAQQMACVYAAADLFVTPAIEDNLPNTVLESLCCGTAVVAFNIGGMPDMVTDGKNGILSNTVDEDGLATAISRAVGCTFDRHSISQRARECYAPVNQAKAYIDLYQEQLTATPSRGRPKKETIR
ncbi:MAG: glycosyltransferase [Granulosicoccus sp.]|nr:glycosyltransferase [Granulosicoccus sp.]